MTITITNRSARAHGFFYGTSDGKTEFAITPTQKIKVGEDLLDALRANRHFVEAVTKGELEGSIPKEIKEPELPLAPPPKPKADTDASTAASDANTENANDSVTAPLKTDADMDVDAPDTEPEPKPAKYGLRARGKKKSRKR